MGDNSERARALLLPLRPNRLPGAHVRRYVRLGARVSACEREKHINILTGISAVISAVIEALGCKKPGMKTSATAIAMSASGSCNCSRDSKVRIDMSRKLCHSRVDGEGDLTCQITSIFFLTGSHALFRRGI